MQHAAQERVRLGIAAPAAAVVPAAGVPAGGGPGGGGIAPAPVPALAGPGNVGGAVAALPNLAGAGGGHAGLVRGLAAGGPGANQSMGEDDARTLAISRDVDGLRFKEFRSAVQEAKPAEFADWPSAGPRTVKYVISQMLEHGGSAIAHHQAWRVACKLQPTDGPAMEHEA